LGCGTLTSPLNYRGTALVLSHNETLFREFRRKSAREEDDEDGKEETSILDREKLAFVLQASEIIASSPVDDTWKATVESAYASASVSSTSSSSSSSSSSQFLTSLSVNPDEPSLDVRAIDEDLRSHSQIAKARTIFRIMQSKKRSRRVLDVDDEADDDDDEE